MNADIGHLHADIPIPAFSWRFCDRKGKVERKLLLFKLCLREGAWNSIPQIISP